jgi:methylaspartate ammonia-lyase
MNISSRGGGGKLKVFSTQMQEHVALSTSKRRVLAKPSMVIKKKKKKNTSNNKIKRYGGGI